MKLNSDLQMNDLGQPILHKTPCYVQPGCQLYNQDCLITMQEIETGSVDLILQDPPYGTTDNDWDTMPHLSVMWNEWERIIKDNGAIIMTASQPFTSSLIMSRADLFRYSLVWDKQRTSASQLCNVRPLPAHEDIVVFYKMKPTYNPQKTKGKRMKKGGFSGKHTDNYKSKTQMLRSENDDYYPTSVLSFLACHNMTGKWHPTEKPIDLMRYLLRTYSNENDLVFDGYSGSGTTAAACIKEKRRFIGSELSKEYFDLSVRRLEEIVSQPELF